MSKEKDTTQSRQGKARYTKHKHSCFDHMSFFFFEAEQMSPETKTLYSSQKYVLVLVVVVLVIVIVLVVVTSIDDAQSNHSPQPSTFIFIILPLTGQCAGAEAALVT